MIKRLGILCLCSVWFFLQGCGSEPAKEKTEGPGRLVKSVLLSDPSQEKQRSFPGTVIASKRVVLAFQVSGQVTKFPVKDGEVVKEGQLLASLDPRDYKNKLSAETARLNKSTRDLARATELLRTGTIPPSTHDKTKAAYEVAKANTDIAKKALTDTLMRAPFSGLVADTFVQNFEFIKEKQQILALQDIRHIDIIVNLPESDVARGGKIRSSHEVRGMKIGYVSFVAVGKQQFPVTVKEYRTIADPITQTFKVTLTMPAPENVNI